jgi:hypothetical protein
MTTCRCCDDCGWVCEEHPDKPWEGRRACGYGAAGMPCPLCNVSDGLTTPRLPGGFVDDDDISWH